MKKLQLELTTEDPFEIIGILSSLKSYHLASQLNKIFDYDLIRHEEDLEIELKNTQSYHFIYSYTIPDNLNKIYLIGNKSSHPLLADRKDFDYLIVIKGEHQLGNIKQYLDQIKSIRGVLFVEHNYSHQFKSLNNHPLYLLP
ncbi:MAG: IPExxxVDY family protein [Bacteroidetes bacterium]|nr:IPExxxVDY family protein [Bacteroidota bacterium]